MATIKLLGNNFVPAVFAGAIRAGQGEDKCAICRARYGPRINRREAHALETNHMKNVGESVDGFFK